MKPNRSLRLLCLLGFLLLMAPFYDSCDGEYGFVREREDGTPIQVEKTTLDKIYEVVVDEFSFNGYEIASLSYYASQDVTFKEFKDEFPKAFVNKDWYKNLGMIISLIFDFIVVFSFSIFVLSFTKKIKVLNKLALINSILIITTLLYIVFLESTFEHFQQIKWGYYAFIIIQIWIFVISNSLKRIPNSQIKNQI